MHDLMFSIMNDALLFEQKIRNIEETEIVVLRHVHKFPVYHREIISPLLVLSINFRGSAKLRYDMREIIYCPNEISVVLPNHLLYPIESSENYDVTLLVLSTSFANELKLRTLSHDYAKFHSIPSFLLNQQQLDIVMKTIDIIENISSYDLHKLPKKHDMLIYQVDILFKLLNSFRFDMDEKISYAHNRDKRFNDFCDLLSIHFKEQRNVKFYADKMNLSPKYLSKIIKEASNISPNRWIEEYVVVQIQQILTTRPDLTCKEIAYQTGFNEMSTFCRYFKKNTGKSPTEYRKQNKK